MKVVELRLHGLPVLVLDIFPYLALLEELGTVSLNVELLQLVLPLKLLYLVLEHDQVVLKVTVLCIVLVLERPSRIQVDLQLLIVVKYNLHLTLTDDREFEHRLCSFLHSLDVLEVGSENGDELLWYLALVVAVYRLLQTVLGLAKWLLLSRV